VAELEKLHQELTNFRILLSECFIAESDLACFMLDKASTMELDTDATFKLKWLSDRVHELLAKVRASDDNLQRKRSDEDFTGPQPGLCYGFGTPNRLLIIGTSPRQRVFLGLAWV